MTTYPWPDTQVSIHVYSIVKGIAEGDATKHFATLSGMGWHLSDAINAGLVRHTAARRGLWPDTVGPDLLTDQGRDLWETHLRHLPPGRGYLWPDNHPHYPPEEALA